MAGKRLIICADGTWNDPEDEIPTNVLRVARAIAPHDSNGTPQVVFYDWGVGSYYGNVSGGVAGVGLEKNIQDGYRFIVQNYAAGDEIFLFGFSRGAYTVRALAGMLNKCGVLRKDKAAGIPEAFAYYKRRKDTPGSAAAKAWRAARTVDGAARGPVRFLGVWDTVGALGIPTRALAFVEERDLFYDPVLGSNVACARHAVAIDERRADFEPTLWSNDDAKDMLQVWFAGVHGDLGGGSKARTLGTSRRFLSDLALAWMVAEATAEGLHCQAHVCGTVRQLHKVPISKSYRRFYRMLGSERRRLPADAVVHASVRQRFLADDKYRPPRLVDWLAEHQGDWGALVP